MSFDIVGTEQAPITPSQKGASNYSSIRFLRTLSGRTVQEGLGKAPLPGHSSLNRHTNFRRVLLVWAFCLDTVEKTVLRGHVSSGHGV
jgi:hypothetical protein